MTYTCIICGRYAHGLGGALQRRGWMKGKITLNHRLFLFDACPLHSNGESLQPYFAKIIGKVVAETEPLPNPFASTG